MSVQSHDALLSVEPTRNGIACRFVPERVCLDAVNTDVLGELLAPLVELSGSGALTLDFGNVEYLSSIALNMLLRVHRRAQTLGGRIVVHNVKPEVYEVFWITQLTRLFHVSRPEPAVQ